MLSTIDGWEIIGAIASSLSAITSLIAIPLVAVQLRSNNRIAKAQLINELERDISLHASTYMALTVGGKWHDRIIDFSDEDRVTILNYISFFERVNQIIETKVLDLETIDRIFAGRFFHLFNNPNVKHLLATIEIAPYMKSMCLLYDRWYAYRRANNLPIPLDRH